MPTPSANPAVSGPDVELLLRPEKTTTPESDQELQARGAILIHTLREFSIQAQIDRIERGQISPGSRFARHPASRSNGSPPSATISPSTSKAPHVGSSPRFPVGRPSGSHEVPNLNIEAVRLRDLAARCLVEKA